MGKLEDKNTNINIPLFTELPATTAIAVKARMEAVLSQIRDHKSGTLAERYGPDAQFRPDVTKDTNTSYQDWMRVSGKQANMQENLTAARANNGVPVVPSINAGGEKGKTVAGAPAQKPTAIPGL